MQVFTYKITYFGEIPANMQAFSLFSVRSSEYREKACIIAGIYYSERKLGGIPAILQEFPISRSNVARKADELSENMRVLAKPKLSTEL